MSEKYDYILKWTKNSTKAEHHIPEIEEFARNNHKLFMDYHELSKPIIKYDENTDEYMEAKKRMFDLFDKNEETAVLLRALEIYTDELDNMLKQQTDANR